MSDTQSNEISDNGLLRQAVDGNEEAFAQLFDRYGPELRKMIQLRLDDQLARRCDASDVMQETRVETFRRLSEFLDRRPMPFAMWLRQTALQQLRNLRRHHVQTAKRSVLREQAPADRSSMLLAQSLCQSGETPSAILARREAVAKLERSLLDLCDDDRELLLMRYVEGRPNEEIALLLGISQNAASKRHGAALLRLRKVMKNASPDTPIP